MAPKRKRPSLAAVPTKQADTLPPVLHETPILPPSNHDIPTPAPGSRPPKPTRQASRRGKVDTNPDHNADIVDGPAALRASPDADEMGEALDVNKVNGGTANSRKVNGGKRAVKDEESDSPLSDLDTPMTTEIKKNKKTPTKSSIAAKKGSDEIKAFKAEQAAKKATEVKVKKEDDDGTARGDPDGDDDLLTEDIDAVKQEAARPPPVHSDYLPLPWKGRLGYVSTILSPRSRSCSDVSSGLFEHISSVLKSSHLHIQNVPDSLGVGGYILTMMSQSFIRFFGTLIRITLPHHLIPLLF